MGKKRKLWLFILVVFLYYSFPTLAGGLFTPFGEVLVENLKIGEKYSIRQIIKSPWIVCNTSEREVKLKLEVIFPKDEELKDGFEAIPEVFWVKIKQEDFKVKSGQEVKTDIFIDIPNEKHYAGRKYQVYIWSHTVGDSLGVGLKSRLLFTTCN